MGLGFDGDELMEATASACQWLGFSKDLSKSKRGLKEDIPILFSLEDLKLFTNDFNEEKNLIGTTQFGRVYRGKILERLGWEETRDVTVKIWVKNDSYILDLDDYADFLDEEIMFLTDRSVNCHPNVVKLLGYCLEGHLVGIVYDLNPLNNLHNLIRGDNLTWTQRIKIALGFAHLLEYLHGLDMPYVVRNIDAQHIMLDQDYNPKLFDFGLMIGGVLGIMTRIKYLHAGSTGYEDPNYGVIDICSDKNDVFSFGVVLLGLISKRLFDLGLLEAKERASRKINVQKSKYWEDVCFLDEWAMRHYKPRSSLVHKSLQKDSSYHAHDGIKITELAVRCVEFDRKKRPTMKEVVKCLESFLVVQLHGDALGMRKRGLALVVE